MTYGLNIIPQKPGNTYIFNFPLSVILSWWALELLSCERDLRYSPEILFGNMYSKNMELL